MQYVSKKIEKRENSIALGIIEPARFELASPVHHNILTM